MFTPRDVQFPTHIVSQTQSAIAPTPAKAALPKFNLDVTKITNIIDKTIKKNKKINKKAISNRIKELQKIIQKHPNKYEVKLEIIELQKQLRNKE